MLRLDCVRDSRTLHVLLEQVNDELWRKFMAWSANKERVTYYKNIDGLSWTVEWFDEKATFHYREGQDLITIIEEIIKDGK